MFNQDHINCVEWESSLRAHQNLPNSIPIRHSIFDKNTKEMRVVTSGVWKMRFISDMKIDSCIVILCLPEYDLDITFSHNKTY